ncbi:MAG: ATP-binding protein [Vulcanimicrobiaceae bacterium]
MHVPNARDVEKLISIALKNLETLKKRIKPSQYERVKKTIASFNFDVTSLEKLGDPKFRQEAGTAFIIQPASRLIADGIASDPNDKDAAPKMLQTLLGFTNTMSPKPKANFAVEFWDHETAASAVNLIAQEYFFVPEEFKECDHHVSGAFSSTGEFRGSLRIFNAKPISILIPPPPQLADKEVMQCGPFDLNVGVLQGAVRESRMDRQRWVELTQKTKRIGGVYVYDDGVRVLPYGGPENDFLYVERNRSKGAGFYFFSYRRMFGYVDLSRRQNERLQQKAGREGFRENTAYLEFTSLLRNFFVKLAAYFREKDPLGESFTAQKDQIEKINVAKDRAEKEHRQQRRAFEDRLDHLAQEANEDRPNTQARAIVSDLERKLGGLRAGSELITRCGVLEAAALDAVQRLRQHYRLETPPGRGFDPDVRLAARAYDREYHRMDSEIFAAAVRDIQALVAARLTALNARVNPAKRLSATATAAAQRARAALKESARSTEKEASQLLESIQSRVVAAEEQIDALLDTFVAQVTRGRKTSKDFSERLASLDQRIASLQVGVSTEFDQIRTQLAGISSDGRNGGISSMDIRAAFEDELLELRSRSEDDLQLAQLGMAVQIVNHEFSESVKSVRAGLGELRGWARVNTKLAPVYKQISTSFEHLDSYLGLFTPLQRRTYRKATEITGSELYRFLSDLFSARFEKEQIELTATQAFHRYRFTAIPSTFYPVFVNLLDNASFWLRQKRGSRTILLDADSKGMYVSNSGPAIGISDRDRVFEYGFTRKPSGSGLGLFISRQVLRREGYDITLTSKGQMPVTFAIVKR